MADERTELPEGPKGVAIHIGLNLVDPAHQSPNYLRVGRVDESFDVQDPFSI